MKIFVCDLLGVAADWLEQYALLENLEIVGSISMTDRTQAALLVEKSWDYLLVFEKDSRPFLTAMFHFLNIPDERIIYAQDVGNLAAHPAAVLALIKPSSGSVVHRVVTFFTAQKLNRYISCTTSTGLNYVATSEDKMIMLNMYAYRKNWAEDEMKIFHVLAKKYYQIDHSSGLFLDLGANIGTTGIYFLKELTPNLKLLAFEPDAENFKLLRVNLILNDLLEKSTVVNCGLGAADGEETMYQLASNPGMNGMFTNLIAPNIPSETIKIIPLDKYFAENNLDAEDVKYIWIDTEGFEAQVLLGAQNILRKNPAPIFMEFNPTAWQNSGFYGKILALLGELYESYIWIYENNPDMNLTPQPIEKLWEFQNAQMEIGKYGDIFLIKKS